MPSGSSGPPGSSRRPVVFVFDKENGAWASIAWGLCALRTLSRHTPCQMARRVLTLARCHFSPRGLLSLCPPLPTSLIVRLHGASVGQTCLACLRSPTIGTGNSSSSCKPPIPPTMASSPDSCHDARRTQRRDSSPRSSGRRRPRLLRVAATEPSITTCTAIRNSLADSQSPPRATDLLNRVAFVLGSPSESMIRSASPMPARSALCATLEQRQQASWPDTEAYGPPACAYVDSQAPDPFWRDATDSCRYFSFPSFDMYHVPLPDEEKAVGLKAA